MAIGGNAKDQKQYNQELGETEKRVKKVNEEASKFPETFREYRDLVTAINQELGEKVNLVRDARSNYRSLTSIAKQLQTQEEGITRLSDKQLDNNKAKARIALDELKSNAAKLADEQKVLDLSGQALEDRIKILETTGKISAEEAALLRAREAGFAEEDKLLGLIENEIDKRKESNRLMGVAGGLAATLNGLLGPLASSLGLKEAADKMQEVADKVAETKGSFGKIRVLGAGIASIFGSLGETLTDPAVLITAMLSTYNKFADAARTVRQETGIAGNHLAELASSASKSSDALITSVGAMETIAALSAETEMNIAAAFSVNTIAAATELHKTVGLTAEETGNLALRAEVFGDSLGSAQSQAIAITQEYLATGKGAIKYQNILKDAGKVSDSLALSIKGGQKGLLEAAAAASKLGLNLGKVEAIADQLLDFESSIAAELEAELLTGQSINLEKARTYALNNEMEKLSREIGNNEAILESFASGNRFQQEAIAKSLGMQKEDVAKMIFFSEKNKNLTDEQKELASGISKEEANRLKVQEQFARALEKITAAAVPYVEALASLLSNEIALKSLMVVIGAAITVNTVKRAMSLASNFKQIGMSAVDAAKGVKNFAAGLKGGEGGIVSKIASGFKNMKAGGLGAGGDATKAAAGGVSQAANATKGVATGGVKRGNSIRGFLRGLGDGLKAMSGTKVLQGALNLIPAALGFVAMTAGALGLAAVALAGNAAGAGLQGLSTGLTVFAQAMAAPTPLGPVGLVAPVALALLGAAMIPFAYALSLAAPAIEAIGTVIHAVFTGVGVIITSVAEGFVMLMDAITLKKALMLPIMGFGLISLAGGVMALAAVSPFLLTAATSLVTLGLSMIPLALGFEMLENTETEKLIQSLSAFVGLAPSMLLLADALFRVSMGLGAIGLAGIVALPIVTALAGLGTVSTGIAGIFGGSGTNPEESGTSTAAMEAKLDELNQNMNTLITTVKEGGVINIDSNKAGTFFAMGASKLA